MSKKSNKSPKFVTSCCGRDIDYCPGCKENTVLIPQDDGHDMKILKKIKEGTVTVDDFNTLIQEAMPESVRDRVRRRTTVNPLSSHIDDSGHQKTSLPNFTKRIAPKRERSANTQMSGAGKAGHRRSTRTQRRKARRLHEDIQTSSLHPLTKSVEHVGELSKQLIEILSRLTISGTVDTDEIIAIRSHLKDIYDGSLKSARLFLQIFKEDE